MAHDLRQRIDGLDVFELLTRTELDLTIQAYSQYCASDQLSCMLSTVYKPLTSGHPLL